MKKTRKLYPTTFGLFWEWYTECGECIQEHDVTAEWLEKYLGKYFEHASRPIEERIDSFLGIEMKCRVFTGYEDLAKFIRDCFDIPILLEQYAMCGTQFIKFNLAGIEFDIECCDDWGTYNFPVDVFGRKIIEK